LAPNAKLRALVVPQGPAQPEQVTAAADAAECNVEPAQALPHQISWARLLERVFDIHMQHCPKCGAGELKIIAAILERPVIQKILDHLGLDPQPPPRGRAREPGPHFAPEPRPLSKRHRHGLHCHRAAGAVLRAVPAQRSGRQGQP
jgi:hypothetical protein